jgi:hypothetical protein
VLFLRFIFKTISNVFMHIIFTSFKWKRLKTWVFFHLTSVQGFSLVEPTFLIMQPTLIHTLYASRFSVWAFTCREKTNQYIQAWFCLCLPYLSCIRLKQVPSRTLNFYAAATATNFTPPKANTHSNRAKPSQRKFERHYWIVCLRNIYFGLVFVDKFARMEIWRSIWNWRISE